MSTQTPGPTRLASEDVIINAPMSYAGSAQRIMRLRRHGSSGAALAALTVLALTLSVLVWMIVSAWYLIVFVLLGLVTVPYRLLRRGSRKRKAEAMRHRELMGTIQGSAAASAAAIVAATAVPQLSAIEPPTVYSPSERVADADRERAIEELREHMLSGRLNAEEFEDRLGSAHSARTRADLDAVRTDLP